MSSALPRSVWGRPAAGRPRALIILVHGGGWAGIDPVAFNATLSVATILQRLGYETLTIEYRHGAMGLADLDAFYERARRRVGPNLPVCAEGSSAGGHLALMLAVDHPELNCVIDLAGPTDLVALGHESGGGAAYAIALHQFGRERLGPLSPARRAGSIRARILLVYAENDPLVPVAQGRDMAAADPSAHLIILPPGAAGFVHTGVGVPAAESGVDATALAKAQQAEVNFMASVAPRR